MSDIFVIKATGEREPFSEEKVIRSIRRAGIPDSLQSEVLSHVKEKIYPEIPTSEVYHHIIEFLGKSTYPYTRNRYSLKQAIMDLGPTGFPFERFIAAVLREQGYQCQTDVIIPGLCISHEVDVLAEYDNQQIMIECKFHNRVGTRTDVKVALYVRSRYEDLVAGYLNKNNTYNLKKVWLVTNTKCTTDAVLYAKCAGITIISWGYPEGGNLQTLVEKNKLHPVTCLTNLSNYHKNLLLQNNIVLCKDLLTNRTILALLKLNKEEEERLVSEIKLL